ncbi:unnamed protein product, partial [Rotaria sordida]
MFLILLLVLKHIQDGYSLKCIDRSSIQILRSEFTSNNKLHILEKFSNKTIYSSVENYICHVRIHINYNKINGYIIVEFDHDTNYIYNYFSIETSFTLVKENDFIISDIEYRCLSYDICDLMFINKWIYYLVNISYETLQTSLNHLLESSIHSNICYVGNRLTECIDDAFHLAIKTDPTFVEPHIGRLFGYKHVLWGYTDRKGALQAWNDSWSTFNEHNITLTPLQSAYFNAIFQLFAYENVRDGEKAFLTSMLNLTRQYPLDNDAQTLLGLAYLNEANNGLSEAQTTETST